jgi:hypothetical protein
MNKVLLIWEEVPEETKLYYFDGLTDEEYNKLCMCQNHFINMKNVGETDDEAAALNWLNSWLENKQNYLLSKNVPFKCNVTTTVIFAGFLL